METKLSPLTFAKRNLSQTNAIAPGYVKIRCFS